MGGICIEKTQYQTKNENFEHSHSAEKSEIPFILLQNIEKLKGDALETFKMP